MPVEALENRMLDAIEAELVKIGTAPTSAWLTTPTPTIKLGVPGDKVPGPNLTTLYLQHLGSKQGTDSVGTALHKLECAFAIWCCSSHAADGQRRVLNLLQDVRRALLSAEPTFYELFTYGSEMGDFQFTGDDARIRAGVSMGALEFRITGELKHEEDMTEAETRALIEKYLKKGGFWRMDHNYAYGASNTPPFMGLRAIPQTTNKQRGQGFWLDTSTGINKTWVAGVGYNSVLAAGPGGGVWAPFYFSMRMNRTNPVGTTAGERFQGIGWGDTPGVDTPWATNLASDSGCQSTVQLRYNLTREKWEVFLWNTIAAVTLDCDIQPGFSVDTIFGFPAIEWTGSQFKFYLNGQLAKTVTPPGDYDFFFGTINGNGPYFFYTNGSGSGAAAGEAGFYQGHVYQPQPLQDGTFETD
jgi:hypothetical protein